MRRILLFPIVLGFLCTSVALAKSPDPYEVIDKQTQAEAVMRDVVATMGSRFGLRITTPVQIHLVEAKEMDKLFSGSPYHGAEIGLYTGISNGKHQLYVMKGWARDQCAGITAHELTHAWQTENVPADQDLVLREGFAKWVEYKYYDLIGAYTYSQQIRETADPVYGVGFFAVLDAEAAVGAPKVADLMKGAHSAKDLPKKK